MDRLIEAFAALPGIGRRSAERLAFHVLKNDEAAARTLAQAVTDVKTQVRHCRVCFTLCDGERCGICADPERARSRVLVVEQPKDLIALEGTGAHDGVYHVLMGRLAPLDGIGPESLTIDHLLERVDHPDRFMDPGEDAARIEEVILGLNPTLEGDGTALYLSELLRSRGVRVSRLARGLPTGGTLEFASVAVLADAIEGRRSME